MRHQLDVQSKQINRVLSHHQVPATVTGGTVRPRVVNFDLQTQLAAGLERIRGLKGDLINALGVGDVALTQDDGQWHLRVSRPDDPPVPLRRLLATAGTLPPHTVPIGLADGGRPVMLQFSTKRMSHILIAGDPGAGKTSLLRAIATGLALTNRQSRLQLQILDPQWDDGERITASECPLLPLGYLPHMLTDPGFGMETCASLIHFLAEEMVYRRKERVQIPRIVILIDHTLTLLEFAGQTTRAEFLRLLQYGSQAGIHLILSTDRPGSPLLDSTIKSCLSMRIMGRQSDSGVARRVAGVELDQATLLYGEGDFLAVVGDEITYFQAAHIGDYDLHHELTEMGRIARPTLLAQPYSARPHVGAKPNQASQKPPVSFSLHDGAVNLEEIRETANSDESDAIPF